MMKSIRYISATMPDITGWKGRHTRAVERGLRQNGRLYHGASLGNDLVQGINAWCNYAVSHKARYESEIGQDYVLGKVWLAWGLALRRIAMTLHRWHELECGDGNDYASWCIVRGRKERGQPFEYDEKGQPFEERHINSSNTPLYTRVPDREAGALKRLAKIMAKYAPLAYYVQGDPRGAALYILRPGDVPAGESADCYYSRGLAVYK